MNKNPFEIRLETLKMAKDMLDKQVEMQESFTKQALDVWKEQGKDIAEFWADFTPKMYQPEEIVEKANELYSFVRSNLRTVSGGKGKDAA